MYILLGLAPIGQLSFTLVFLYPTEPAEASDPMSGQHLAKDDLHSHMKATIESNYEPFTPT